MIGYHQWITLLEYYFYGTFCWHFWWQFLISISHFLETLFDSKNFHLMTHFNEIFGLCFLITLIDDMMTRFDDTFRLHFFIINFNYTAEEISRHFLITLQWYILMEIFDDNFLRYFSITKSVRSHLCRHYARYVLNDMNEFWSFVLPTAYNYNLGRGVVFDRISTIRDFNQRNLTCSISKLLQTQWHWFCYFNEQGWVFSLVLDMFILYTATVINYFKNPSLSLIFKRDY